MDKQIHELSREAHRDDCSREAYKMYYQALEAKIAWMEQEAFAASATIERLREALRKTMHHLYDIGCFDHADEARSVLEEKE